METISGTRSGTVTDMDILDYQEGEALAAAKTARKPGR